MKVYRHEIKFIMSRIEYTNLKHMLNIVMHKDQNMKYMPDYYIRSLYFDTLTNDDYCDKVIGGQVRRKIRLRIYETSTEHVKLEIKNKEVDYSIKETAVIKRDDAYRLAQGQYDTLVEYQDDVTRSVYYQFMTKGYKPKVIVDYDREAYTLPIENVRLTFDKQVRAVRSCELFDDRLALFGILPDTNVILEVKYDKYLPVHIRNMLSSVSMQRMSISKYCMARELLG
ncbi:MAG: polyphosphate polymerase domain-containing protein [Lachnospiraceae bacterium]|nr:polyphosphate polymerase domain-containing protein [Lachnospiraceae bacterium]